MKRLIGFLFTGCFHEWGEPFHRGRWRDEFGSTGQYYDCRCKKCGRIKQFRT